MLLRLSLIIIFSVELFDQLGLPFVQRALLELLLLSIISGALGPWIVLRSSSFFTHAVGTAAFPGLIAADAIGIAPQAGAVAAAALVAGGAGTLGTRRDGARTALWLTGSLAVGALIASNASRPSAGIDMALFGSLMLASPGDLAFALAVAAAATLAAFVAGPRWLSAGLRGRRTGHWEALLFVLIGAAAIAQLTAAGSLMASAILVLPAVAVRPWTGRLRAWHLACGVAAFAVGVTGHAFALQFDLPPGAAIAVAAGASVVLARTASALRRASGTRTAVIAILSTCLAVPIVGCGVDSAKPGVVATTPIVASIATEVAGEDMPVTSIIPAGADPHEYEPKPSAMSQLGNARIVITSGAGLDDWVRRLADSSGSTAPILDLSRSIPFPLQDPQDGRLDPHWFQDPRNVAAAADSIAAHLAEIDPAHSAGYRSRAARFHARASTLDRAARECARRLLPGERNLVTDHDAFSYLARRLGLKVVGTVIPSQSSAAAPSARSLDSLADEIRRLEVKAIFPERALDPRIAKALARTTSASASTQLDADTLGPAGSASASWTAMWSGNVERMASALSAGRITCKVGEER